MLSILVLLSACCRTSEAPELRAPESARTEVGEIWEIPLADLVVNASVPAAELAWTVTAGENLRVGVSGDALYAIPEPGWTGRETITVSVLDGCEGFAEVAFELAVGALAGDCDTRFTWSGSGARVEVAGAFNDWTPQAMQQLGDGDWALDLALTPGSWPYKLVIDGQWTCDPAADALQCDHGYNGGSFATCTPGAESCNSLKRVVDCDTPRLTAEDVEVDPEGGRLTATLSWEGATPATLSLTLDGTSVGTWDGAAPYALAVDDLESGRHTLRVSGQDAEGREAEPLHLPFWTDGRDWEGGLLYYAFVDRFSNGDPSNDGSEGSAPGWTDYLGGDWRGVRNKLDYLDDLGVTAIWLTAPQDNPAGAWGDKCGATFTGFHGYWPSDPWAPEEHFGDEAELEALVADAHARGMRVIVDWVGNHVHDDHPYATREGWFNERRVCNDANNWNDIPETCWFDPFLPDIDYTQVEPLEVMVDDAIAFAKRYDLDGYRVDAVKHMPRSVFFNLQSRVKNELEGGMDFYTVGETFDGDRGLIASYTGPTMLDAQFDFPFYFTLRSAFIDQGASLTDLESSWQESQRVFAGRTMSAFLGNHDVPRFVTVADVGDWGVCKPGGQALQDPAPRPGGALPYQKLKLAWTWLLVHEGLPLVYYGDEIGLPGHQDPDNRQMMRFPGELSAEEQGVLDHVRKLGQARRDHPAFSQGDRRVWWEEANVFAWSRVSGSDAVIAVVNRSDEERLLDNGLAWAGLPAGGRWTDVLSGQSTQASGDRLSVRVPARTSVVLVAD
jgi:glycosidase